jgi:hypothetical protein
MNQEPIIRNKIKRYNNKMGSKKKEDGKTKKKTLKKLLFMMVLK